MNPTTAAEAQRSLVADDVSGFERVVGETMPRLFRFASRLLGSEHDAEDVVQESYFRAFSAFRSGGFDHRSEVTTWLFSIVTRVALNSLRARKRRRAGEGDAAAPESNAQRALEAHAALTELSLWLEALPEDQRVALVLKEMEGLTTEEVAAVMGCSTGAAEQRIHRARSTLRRRANE